MSFQLVPKSVTLNDLEQCNNHSQVAAVHPFGLSWAMIITKIITVCDVRLTVQKPSNGVYR